MRAATSMTATSPQVVRWAPGVLKRNWNPRPDLLYPSLVASTIVYKGHGDAASTWRSFFPTSGSAMEGRGGFPPALFHNTMPQWRPRPSLPVTSPTTVRSNTVQGNRSWAVARGPLFRSPVLPDLSDILPVVSLTGSDSQSLDNMLETAAVGGLDPMHAMRMLVPPAWQSVDMIDPDLKAFYEYYATHMEPWDGPAGIVLTDGRYACCTLDRNGLRPPVGSSPRIGTSPSPRRRGSGITTRRMWSRRASWGRARCWRSICRRRAHGHQSVSMIS